MPDDMMPDAEYGSLVVLDEKGERRWISPKEWLPLNDAERRAWDAMSEEERQVIKDRAIYGTATKLAFPDLGVGESSDYDEITAAIKRARPEWEISGKSDDASVMDLLLSEIRQRIPEDAGKGGVLEQIFWQLADARESIQQTKKVIAAYIRLAKEIFPELKALPLNASAEDSAASSFKIEDDDDLPMLLGKLQRAFPDEPELQGDVVGINELGAFLERKARERKQVEAKARKRRTTIAPLSPDGLIRAPSHRISKATIEALMPGAMRPAAEVKQALQALEARGLIGVDKKLWAAYPFDAKDDLHGAIGFSQNPGEAIWTLLQRNGALAVKAQYALWARAYRETDAMPNHFITLSIPQFCDDVGFKRKKRAHTHETKQAAIDVLQLLTSLELLALWQTPQGKTQRVHSPLWTRGAIAEEMDDYADLFGANRVGDPATWDPVAFAYAPGYFFSDAEWRNYNRNVALIGEGLLQLGTNNADKWAVMVGGYLAIQARMNGWRTLKRKVWRVLAKTGLLDELKKHRQAGRMRSMFERALDRLVEVGVIQSWQITSEPEDANADDLDAMAEPEPAQWAAAWMSECLVIEWPADFERRENKLQACKQKRIAAAQQKRKRGRSRQTTQPELVTLEGGS